MVSTVDVLSWIGAELDLPLPDDVDGVPVGDRSIVLAQEFPNGLLLKLGGDNISQSLVAGIEWPWKLISHKSGKNELFRIGDDPLEAKKVEDAARIDALLANIDATQSALVIPEIDRARTMSPEAEKQLRELGYLE